MNWLRDWYLNKKLKWRKQKVLHEVLHDIIFIETYSAEALNPDSEKEWRRQLRLENEKAKQGRQDDKLIDEISYKIAAAQAVRNEYDKLQKLAKELPYFIDML